MLCYPEKAVVSALGMWMEERLMKIGEADPRPHGRRPRYSAEGKLGILRKGYLGVNLLPLTNSRTRDNLVIILKVLASSS